ncbi:hypothetical protein [Roseateles amylovorans]|uniref:Uncharacterized protein n=1 Tax=Roseateles amylovorans TaxID=2978473 RepID=A0ABY6B864_9BURK|nr:hypothetical protein [Roseateles amylovorans]UXH79401.1 hypothetical protein N4261_05590 [Roseateles amylovorans]
MRIIQSLGFLLTAGFVFGFHILTQGMAADAAEVIPKAPDVAGFVLGGPLLFVAALLLVPSSIMLMAPTSRSRHGITGGWFALWCLNAVLSMGFIGTGAALAWALIQR